VSAPAAGEGAPAAGSISSGGTSSTAAGASTAAVRRRRVSAISMATVLPLAKLRSVAPRATRATTVALSWRSRTEDT